MRDWEIAFLCKLREASADGVNHSTIPKRCHAIVEALRSCGAADYLPSTSGRGIRLRIKSEASFTKFVDSRCPSGLDIDFSEIQNRTDAIVYLGDAKAFSYSVAEGVFVRATKPNVTLQSIETNKVISVSELTAIAGCASIQLSDSKSWTFRGSIAVVENADAFWLHERVIPDSDLIIFASGRISGRLLEWLTSPAMESDPILHWGDYDPVGVAEYIRLRTRCGDRVETFVPDDLEALLKRHGKRKLITDQVGMLGRLRQHSANPHVARMIALFDRHRKGLEQELLLNTT